MKKFKDWFENKVTVGPFPIMNNMYFNASEYDYIINVSDEYYNDIQSKIIDKNHAVKSFWFPMNECRKDVGLNSIYGAMIILTEAEKLGKRVYLHCHAGVNRSKCVHAAYYFMRTGEQFQTDTNGYVNRFVAMCARGYLPPKAESEKFLTELSKQLKAHSILGGALDHCKIETINNF